jgi:hemerythrin-like metal-binding protein
MQEAIARLEWTDALKTGVVEIDEQHMILVHTLNEAAEKLTREATAETLGQITQDLLSYALYHFETEEELMQEYGYREAEGEGMQRHLDQHRGFSTKVVSVREGLKSGNLIAPKDLIGFLNDWLVNHIQHTDRSLAAFVLAKRNG